MASRGTQILVKDRDEPIAQLGPPHAGAVSWRERLAQQGRLRLGTQDTAHRDRSVPGDPPRAPAGPSRQHPDGNQAEGARRPAGHAALAPIDDPIVDRAKSPFAVNVHALDAIHVATAELLAAEAEGEPPEFDDRQAAAALSRDLTVRGT